jgi:hypothetical protein
MSSRKAVRLLDTMTTQCDSFDPAFRLETLFQLSIMQGTITQLRPPGTRSFRIWPLNFAAYIKLPIVLKGHIVDVPVHDNVFHSFSFRIGFGL